MVKPLCETKQNWDKPDVNTMYMKCENMRVLIVDEGSSASCENLATAELNVRTAIRAAAETYKVRYGGRGKPNEARICGGLNVLFFVDWWQLPPVKQTAITANPFESQAGNVRTIMNMFWTKGVDAINRSIELTEAKRCQDPWLLAYIQQCRDGRQTWDMYNFIHGYATQVTGSWLPCAPERPSLPNTSSSHSIREYTLLCGNSACYALCEGAWEKERRAGASWPDLVRQECSVCAEHRQLRARVRVAEDDKRHLEPLFAKAPYLHPYNKPRYHALLLRAVQFASSEKRILL